jgi:hypothetical protein
MAIKIPTSSIPRASKMYPNLDFWFENIPSSNTALHVLLKMRIILSIKVLD